MRKMNKIVALSLVLAMALSMMASAASFKDQATINADLIDEINLLVNLGVYSEQGTGDGYFEPNMTITRAQAAKIIYVLKNKGVDNGATSWTGLNIFSDVEVGSWYEGYVNYCASVGILAGTGDNKFTPNGQLTGVEGYVESAGSGLVAGINLAHELLGKEPVDFTTQTALGAMAHYVSGYCGNDFQPMNINFGIIDGLDGKGPRKKEERYAIIAERALARIEHIKENNL